MKVDFIDGLSDHVGAKHALFTPAMANAMLEAQTVHRLTEQLFPLMRDCVSMQAAKAKYVRFVHNPDVFEARIGQLITRLADRFEAVSKATEHALNESEQKTRFYANKVSAELVNEFVRAPLAELGGTLQRWANRSEWKREADLMKPEMPKGAHARFGFEQKLNTALGALERELTLPKFTALLAPVADPAPTQGR